MMTEMGLEFNSTQKGKIKTSENLVYMIFLFFIVIPPIMAFMITVPWDPNHALITDIQEIEVKLQISHIPFLVLFTWFTINMAGVIQLATVMTVASKQLVNVCISCLVKQSECLQINKANWVVVEFRLR